MTPVQALAHELGRTPTKIECLRLGLWTGRSDLSFRDFILAHGLTPRPHGQHLTPIERPTKLTVAQQEAEAYRESVARLKLAKAPERQETDWLHATWMR